MILYVQNIKMMRYDHNLILLRFFLLFGSIGHLSNFRNLLILKISNHSFIIFRSDLQINLKLLLNVLLAILVLYLLIILIMLILIKNCNSKCYFVKYAYMKKDYIQLNITKIIYGLYHNCLDKWVLYCVAIIIFAIV